MQIPCAFQLVPLSVQTIVLLAVLYLNEPIKLDYLWAGLCMVGAVYFIFRSA